jgi:hypothetical protein
MKSVRTRHVMKRANFFDKWLSRSREGASGIVPDSVSEYFRKILTFLLCLFFRVCTCLTHLFRLLILITELSTAILFNSQHQHLNEFVLLEAQTSIFLRIVTFPYDISCFCEVFLMLCFIFLSHGILPVKFKRSLVFIHDSYVIITCIN